MAHRNDEAPSGFLPAAMPWKGIKTVIMIGRIVLEGAVRGKAQPGTSGIGFHVPRPALLPKRTLEVVLKRWSLEDQSTASSTRACPRTSEGSPAAPPRRRSPA